MTIVPLQHIFDQVTDYNPDSVIDPLGLVREMKLLRSLRRHIRTEYAISTVQQG